MPAGMAAVAHQTICHPQGAIDDSHHDQRQVEGGAAPAADHRQHCGERAAVEHQQNHVRRDAPARGWESSQSPGIPGTERALTSKLHLKSTYGAWQGMAQNQAQ